MYVCKDRPLDIHSHTRAHRERERAPFYPLLVVNNNDFFFLLEGNRIHWKIKGRQNRKSKIPTTMYRYAKGTIQAKGEKQNSIETATTPKKKKTSHP